MSAAVDRQRLKAVFHETLSLEPEAIGEFLDRACAGDTELRREVAELVAAHRASPGFMETPLVASPAGWNDLDTADDSAAERIGPYRLIRTIGAGGMGVVYLGTRADDEYQQQVAIKIVKPGFDTIAILHRFRHERQTLADLDHPNIARLLDGGTTGDGRPYFVMEYVEGLPLDEYCDSRALTIPERVALFRTVCDAVHHAHRNLVVHRDLKPDNILVSQDGRVKLLDFGIAKLLHASPPSGATQLTEVFGRAMTPSYASPEQLRGAAISTASDVYSLGVLLYELLSGHKPYVLDGLTFEEIVRAVCSGDPERPSTAIRRTAALASGDRLPPVAVTPESVCASRRDDHASLSRRLRGDLDTIVQTAMHKDPQRRYPSAAQLSDDLGRHLDGLPVSAREDSAFYRMRKFAGRHRAAVAAGLIVALSLVTGLVATLYQARVANAERMRAERRFNDVRRLTNLLLFDLHDGISKLPGSTPLRQRLVAQALEYLNGLAQDAEGSDDLQRELAAAYHKIGDVQGNPYHANLGRPADALASYRRALSLFEAATARDRDDVDALRGLAASYERIGDVLALTSDVAGSLEHQRKGLAIRETIRQRHPAGDAELATSYYKVGESLGWSGDLAAALATCRRALELRAALSAASPRDADLLLAAAASGVKVGELLVATGDRPGGLSQYREAQARAMAAAAMAPVNSRAQRQLAITHGKIAEELSAGGDLSGALREHRTALALRETMLKSDPANAQATREVAISYIMAAEASAATGAAAEAVRGISRAIELFEQLSASNPTNAAARADLVIGYRMAGAILTPSDPRAAIERLTAALTLAKALSAEDPSDVEILRETVAVLSKLGEATAGAARRSVAAERFAQWNASQDWYGQAIGLSQELLKRGAIAAADSDEAALRAGRDRAAAALRAAPAR